MTMIDQESLGPEHLELLTRARDASGMPPAAKTRVLARLGAPLPPGSGSGGGQAPTSSGPLEPTLSVATPTTVPVWVSATLFGLAVVSFGAVAAAPIVGVPNPEDLVVEAPERETPPPPEPASIQPIAEDPAPPEPEPEPVAETEGATDTEGTPDAVSSGGRAEAADTSAEAPASAASIKEETALLAAARKALSKKDPKGALAQLDAHADEFRDGALAEEREALTAVALCEDGQSAAGGKAASRFLASHATSGLAPRVRAACGLEEK